MKLFLYSATTHKGDGHRGGEKRKNEQRGPKESKVKVKTDRVHVILAYRASTKTQEPATASFPMLTRPLPSRTS